MLLIRILSGKAVGREIRAGRFPFSVGRNPDADLSSQEPGVWDRHLELHLDPDTGFQLRPSGEAAVLVNGEPVKTAHLKNGDRIQLGAFEFACWLQPARQSSLFGSELMVWGMIGAILAGQVALLSWLLTR